MTADMTMADPGLREGIDDLFGRYAEAIDEGRLEEWPEFFIEDCRYLIKSRADHEAGLPHAVVYCASKGMLQDRVTAMRRANIFEPHRYRHIAGPVRIVRAEDGIAEMRSNFLVLRIMHDGETSLFASGRYLDRVDTSAQPYRFRERLVILDSQKIDTLLVMPL
jgi:anthranilate 1,2-dioxygenase small subunit